ncbi:MAG: DUF2017 family protein [Verrucomicrobiae bacterium]|nr:DUF2017 family protein [Verrucomicrobiae bacterium]
MRIAKEKDGLVVTFERPIAEWLSEILESLVRRYGVESARLDPRTAEAWYWPKGMESAGGGRASEREEMLRQSLALRGERIPLLRKWIAALGAPRDPVELSVSSAETGAFLACLNDHRLALAARHGWMDAPLEHALEKVADGTKRIALAEIHFLGAILDGLLEAL